MKKPKISESEFEIMKVIWEMRQEASSYEIRKRLEEKTGWERTTILTLIRRLVEKGLLHQVKREVYYYTAAISEKEYKQDETMHFLRKVYDGNAKNLVASLCQNNSLTTEDIAELRSYFNEGGEKPV